MSTLGAWAATLLAAACIAAELVIRFKHPDLTETQLFLDFLPQHAAVAVTLTAALIVWETTK